MNIKPTTNRNYRLATTKPKHESGWWTVLRIGNYPVWIQQFHLHSPPRTPITSLRPRAFRQHAVTWVVGGTATDQMVNREAMQLNVSLKIAFADSQSIHAERILGGGVGENHVRVVEHMKSVQCQGVDLQLVQWELRVCVKADITNVGQCAGEVLGETWRRFSRH